MQQGAAYVASFQARSWLISALVALICTMLTPAATQADSDTPTIDWLEPRGLSVVHLVGHLPESVLRDSIVVFSGEGMVRYVSGTRSGRRVEITVRIGTKKLGGATYLNCLGQWPFRDQWPAVVPPSQMRLFDQGVEITSQIAWIQHYPAGMNQPDHGTNAARYDLTAPSSPQFTDEGAMLIPANMGCVIALNGIHHDLTATFLFDMEDAIDVAVLGSENFTIQSYIGVGDAGRIDSLRSQMRSRYGTRFPNSTLTPPAGVEYVFVKFPPTAVSPYPTGDVHEPSSGTYRLNNSGAHKLSNDHTVSMGLPLYGQWQDADQAGGDYLSFIEGVDTVGGLEYFVPDSVEYDSCMSRGGCSDALLAQIYNATMTLEVHYLQITRPDVQLTRVPLRPVGPGWGVQSAMQREGQADVPMQLEPTIFVPLLVSAPSSAPQHQPEADDRSGCPCGWFDSIGAMLDYTGGP